MTFRRSYMSAFALMKLFNYSGKRDINARLVEHFIAFAKESDKLSYTEARMLNPINHKTLRLF